MVFGRHSFQSPPDDIHDEVDRFVPTPEQIQSMTEAIRSGEVVVSATSRKKWAKIRQDRESSERLNRFDLAGRIAEDACKVPGWLYAAGQ